MTKEQEEIFKTFYDDNESGGSSRWLVSPNIVKSFINTILICNEHIQNIEHIDDKYK